MRTLRSGYVVCEAEGKSRPSGGLGLGSRNDCQMRIEVFEAWTTYSTRDLQELGGAVDVLALLSVRAPSAAAIMEESLARHFPLRRSTAHDIASWAGSTSKSTSAVFPRPCSMTTTTQALATRLSSLSDQNKQTVQLIHRLAKLQFQPGSTPLEGNGNEGDVRVELSSEIHDGLKLQEEELELFRQEVEELIGSRALRSGTKDSEKEREKSRLSIQVARLAEDLKQYENNCPLSMPSLENANVVTCRARSQYRKAQLQAKRNAEAAKQKERELLFAGIQEGGSALPSSTNRRSGNSKLTQDEIVAAASSDVTAALRRTHHLMTSELSRSRFAQETLDASTAALADLGDRYTDLNSLLSSSKTLVNSLLRSQKTDTWYLETTLYILLTTLAWLAYRRFLWGPTWWFVWLPLKLTYKLVFGIFAALGLSGSSSSTSSSSQLNNVSAPAAFSSTVASSSSSSLRVQPSASNRPPPRQPGQQAHFVRAGAGGAGVKQGDPQQQAPYQPHQQEQQEEAEQQHRDPSPDGSMSQQVGRMAEAAAQGQGQAEDVPRRGDGQPLQQSDKPRNPKKRAMDVGEEQERMRREAEAEAEEREREQESKQQQQQQAERQRDEL